MLRSLVCLFLVIPSLIHNIGCVDEDTKPQSEVSHATYRDGQWFSRDWQVKGSNTQVRWQTSFVNPIRRFTYLTYDPSKNYCEIHLVTTDSPNGDTLTCRYKFGHNDYDIEMYGIYVPGKDDSQHIGFGYATAEDRAKRSWTQTFISLNRCRIENRNLGRSEGNNATAASPAAEDVDDTEVTKMTGNAPTLPKIKSDHLESKANGKEASCDLNEARTQVTCTQRDANGKKIIDNVKVNLPTHWKAEWMRVYNLKSAALILTFSSCPDGLCDDYSMIRLTPSGVQGGRIVEPKMNLRCSDVESSLTFELADDPESGQTCIHAICLENDKDKDSKVKIGSLLQYRRLCITGDAVA